MSTKFLLITTTLWAVFGENAGKPYCKIVPVIQYGMDDLYRDQPIFVNVLPKTNKYAKIDNICITFSKLPDGPNIYNLYTSIVYKDGSVKYETYVFTDLDLGRIRGGKADCTYSSNAIGYLERCKTHVYFRCYEYGDCGDPGVLMVVGLSNRYAPLSYSCVKEIKEVVYKVGLPSSEHLTLPMRLKSRCYRRHLCPNDNEANLNRAFNVSRPLPGPLFPAPIPPHSFPAGLWLPTVQPSAPPVEDQSATSFPSSSSTN